MKPDCGQSLPTCKGDTRFMDYLNLKTAVDRLYFYESLRND